MKKITITAAVMLVLVFITGELFAQDQGRVEWYGRARTDIQLNFREKKENENGTMEDFPGIAFYQDNNGSAYSWDTNGELLVWYGKGLTSMWGILSYRQGWGFESKYNLSYDNNHSGNAGGKIQTGSRWDKGLTTGGFNPFLLNRLSMYGWFQAWNKRIFMEINPFGATEEEWGPIWRTPGNLFNDDENESGVDTPGNTGVPREKLAFYDHNIDAFFRIQFKNVVENLNFGVTFPQFGKLNSLNWAYNGKIEDGVMKYWEAKDLLMRTSIGFKYTTLDYGFAGGFKFDPDKAQRAYLGGEYKVLDQRLGIRADMKMLNIGGFGDNLGDLDLGEGVEFRDGPLNATFTLYQQNLLWNENKEIELRAEAQGKYVIIGRKLLGRLRVSYEFGVGDENNNYNKFEFEPGLFWALGSQGVTDNLDNYSGMYIRFNYQTGKNADETDIDEARVFIGFRWTK